LYPRGIATFCINALNVTTRLYYHIFSTFARIFYRNAINIGLPILECEEAANDIEMGDKVEVDFNTGVITNVTKNKTYQAEPFPEFMQEMFKVGGLVEQTKVKLGLK